VQNPFLRSPKTDQDGAGTDRSSFLKILEVTGFPFNFCAMFSMKRQRIARPSAEHQQVAPVLLARTCQILLGGYPLAATHRAQSFAIVVGTCWISLGETYPNFRARLSLILRLLWLAVM
jgi:hypothetical protein